MRNVTQDYTLHGQTLRAGDHVLLRSARPRAIPEAFGDADRFRIDRALNNHLAFGHGPHTCPANTSPSWKSRRSSPPPSPDRHDRAGRPADLHRRLVCQRHPLHARALFPLLQPVACA
jgi:hypothetical protein